MMCHTFLIGDRSGLQAGQLSTHTLCLWSQAAVTRTEWGVALSCWNRGGVPGKSHCLDGSMHLSKFQPKPLHQWYLHMYADHPCRGHWCTPIPSQRLAFTLFVGKSRWSFSSLAHRIQRPFFPKTSWNVDQRTRFHYLLVYLRLHCIMQRGSWTQFQIVFLEQQRTVLSDNNFQKYCQAHVTMSIMVAWRFLKKIPPEGSVMHIQQRFLPLGFTHKDFSWLPEFFHNIMNCGWWKT